MSGVLTIVLRPVVADHLRHGVAVPEPHVEQRRVERRNRRGEALVGALLTLDSGVRRGQTRFLQQPRVHRIGLRRVVGELVTAALGRQAQRVRRVLRPEGHVHDEVADAPVLHDAGSRHQLEVDRLEGGHEGIVLGRELGQQVLGAAHRLSTVDRRSAVCSR